MIQILKADENEKNIESLRNVGLGTLKAIRLLLHLSHENHDSSESELPLFFTSLFLTAVMGAKIKHDLEMKECGVLNCLWKVNG